jgi:hypothetical protein|nr:MAG TPA: hypothetical protein [Caudoviricetes sp.]
MVKKMKMKYQLQGFEVKFGSSKLDLDGAVKVDGLEIEQEFDAKDIIELGIPAIKEITALIINTQKELSKQVNENSAREISLQERKFNEELRRNRRIFNKKESQ